MMTTTTARPSVTSEPGPELRLYAGLEKPVFLEKKPSPVVFLSFFFF